MTLFEALSCLTTLTVVQCGTIPSDTQLIPKTVTSDNITAENSTSVCNFTQIAHLKLNISDACANNSRTDCSNSAKNSENCYISAWEAFDSKVRTIRASIAGCGFLVFICLVVMVTTHCRKILLFKNKWQFRYKRKEFEDTDDIFTVENDNTLMSYGSMNTDRNKTHDDRDEVNDGLVEVELDKAEITV
ncbi:hypothetical protein ACF0H5_006884 [Mactra antiquata]